MQVFGETRLASPSSSSYNLGKKGIYIIIKEKNSMRNDENMGNYINLTNIEEISEKEGVYFVYVQNDIKDEIVDHFEHAQNHNEKEGKNPYPLKLLQNKWNLSYKGNETIVYIGSSKKLKSRIKGLDSYLKDRNGNHYGGCALCQIKNLEILIKFDECDDYRLKENQEIRKFAEKYGCLPFANMKL